MTENAYRKEISERVANEMKAIGTISSYLDIKNKLLGLEWDEEEGKEKEEVARLV